MKNFKPVFLDIGRFKKINDVRIRTGVKKMVGKKYIKIVHINLTETYSVHTISKHRRYNTLIASKDSRRDENVGKDYHKFHTRLFA